MPVDFVTFGSPNRFEIAIRSRRQRRPEDWPLGYGWSLGDLRLTIGGHVITRNVHNGQSSDFSTWYLLPIFEWLADNWVALLHEEDFDWIERSPATAAAIVPRVLAEVMGKDDEPAVARFDAAQRWRERHGLRSAANGGMLPDLYIRRFLDTIELSWSDTPTLFAPDGFRFVLRPGYASCTVSEVATPLWDALDEFVSGVAGRPTLLADRERLAALTEKLAWLRGLTIVDFAKARVAPSIVTAALAYLGDDGMALFEGENVIGGAPAIAAFSPAIAMYGGLNPSLDIADVRRLSDVALAARARAETPQLAAMVDDLGGSPRTSPYLEGYRLAEDLLEDLVDNDSGDAIDIREMINRLGIVVVELALQTDTIRGVGLAGQGTGPTIVINLSSPFNAGEEGKRFTLAHEFCHILYDRGRARRVGIASGPWAPAAVERRANAFAAEMMMPRELVIRAFAGRGYATEDAIAHAAELLLVSRRALIEHLHNIHLIDETSREYLRTRGANTPH